MCVELGSVISTAVAGVSLTEQHHIHRIARLRKIPDRNVLPQWLDPRKLAHQNAEIEGLVGSENLPRLANAVAQLAPATVVLSFAVNDGGVPVVEGESTTEVRLVCQRCLMPMAQGISATFTVGVVADELDATDLPPQMDPWVVNEAVADVYALIEDELLLALPMIPMHPLEQCCAEVVPAADDAPSVSRPKPFDMLRQLKTSNAKVLNG